MNTYTDNRTTAGVASFWSAPGGKSIVIGICIATGFVLAALFGSVGPALNLYPYAPTEVDFVNFDSPPAIPLLQRLLDRREYGDEFRSDSFHFFGTDNDGRDVFIRVCSGASTYLFAGMLTVIISLVLGIALGASEYYSGSFYDASARFLISVIDAYPRIIMLIIVAFISNFNLYAITVTLGFLSATRPARIIAGKIATMRDSDSVAAAHEIGLPDRTIILKHIVWYNCRQLLSVQIIYIFAGVILIEATLSYIGYGIGDPLVSWGRMIYEGAGGRYPFNLVEGMYWQVIPPAAAIILTILGLNLLGDGLSKRISRRQTEYL